MHSKRAKLFLNGASQAVRLPKEFRFPDDQTEVLVRREGRRVVLEPIDTWSEEFQASLGAWPDELERPRQTPMRDLKSPRS